MKWTHSIALKAPVFSKGIILNIWTDLFWILSYFHLFLWCSESRLSIILASVIVVGYIFVLSIEPLLHQLVDSQNSEGKCGWLAVVIIPDWPFHSFIYLRILYDDIHLILDPSTLKQSLCICSLINNFYRGVASREGVDADRVLLLASWDGIPFRPIRIMISVDILVTTVVMSHLICSHLYARLLVSLVYIRVFRVP